MRALVWLVFVVPMLAACGGRAPGWHVDGGFLRAPDGRAAILRGMNLSGTQKSAPYLDDKQETDYARVRADWGMNALRFVMTWSAVEPSPGVYDEAYLDGVAARMRWAQTYGLSVVLDMHEDVYGEGFGFDGAPRWTCDESRYAAFVPAMPWFLSTQDANVEACVDDFYTRADLQERFTAAWRHVAERLAAEPAVVGFDVLNEPEWGSYSIFDFEPDRLAPFYGRIVRAVRGAAPGWVAFLEPSSARNAGIASSLTAFDFDDVVYAPHSYDAAAEGGGGFDPTHRQQILDNVAKLAGEAQSLHAALWIGEYGGMATAPGIVEYMTAQYDAAGQAAAGGAYWAYDDGGYGPVNSDGSERAPLVDVLVRPYPARVAGDPIAYAFDAATSTFTMSWTPGAALATEIVVPARAYPSGWSVDCAGCVWHADGDELVVTTPPTDRPATLRIHP
jgi:endoglycosylceramidase